MKNNKTIYWKSGGSGDYFIEALREKEIDIKYLLQVIDQNVSSEKPWDMFNPFNFFNTQNILKERFRIIEKFKLFNLFMDYATDTRRFKLTEDEFHQLNSIRFINQKLTYSLINLFENKEEESFSHVWITSLLRMFIETNVYWDGLTVYSPRKIVKSTWDEFTFTKWDEYSEYLHRPNNNPFVHEGDFYPRWVLKDLLLIMEQFELKIIPKIIRFFDNTPLRTVVKKVFSWFELLNDLPEIYFKNESIRITDMFELRMKDFRAGQINMMNISFSNPAFLRAYTCLDIDWTDEERMTLANCSHKDIYKFIPLKKYNDRLKSFEDININHEYQTIIFNSVEKIQNFINKQGIETEDIVVKPQE